MKYPVIIISIFIATTLFIAGCSDNSVSADSEPEATITLNNSGARAYTVVSISGEGASAEINTENPEITLTIGGRYTFINNGGASSHPLDFRDANGEKLFGQSRNDGSEVTNPDINLVNNENSISFTLSEEIAGRLTDYICFFHPGMNGSFRIVDAI